MMWGSDYGGGMGFGGFGLLIWILLIVVVIAAMRSFFSGSSPGGKSPSPLDILKRRLASGEIDEEEYQRLKKQLEKDDV